MPIMPGIPYDQGVLHGPMTAVNAVVLHRTYGAWGGDYSVGKQGIFQFLIGKADGNWVQFAPSEDCQWHCNGANRFAVGIELEGRNEEPLTDWQAARLGDVLRWINAAHGVPLTYTDPITTPAASIWVNAGDFHGVISHCSVRTDDGSYQHSDFITVGDFERAVGGTPTPSPSTQENGNVTIYGTTDGKWYLGSGYGLAECDAGIAYVHAVGGCPVVKDLAPLAIIGISVTLAKARKNADYWATRV